MSTVDIPAPPKSALDRLAWTVRDGATVSRRAFDHLRAEPGQLIGAIVFPSVLVVLFGYVFGSAIAVPGATNYREYLMPGLFAMSAIFAVLPSALLLCKDVAEGVVDRFRSMPMARSALPLGRKKLRRQWGLLYLKQRRLTLPEETLIGLCKSMSRNIERAANVSRSR